MFDVRDDVSFQVPRTLDVRPAWRTAAQKIEARIQAAARGTGRAMSEAAARSLTVRTSGKGVDVRIGGARAPFALGDTFGARRNITRTRSTGQYRGLNQFEAPRRGGGWLFGGLRAADEDVADLIETEAVREMERVLQL